MNLLLQFVTCTIRTFLAKFTLLNSVDGDIVSNKLEFSTARAKIVKNIIIFISNVCCTPTLKEVEGGGWSRGKSGAFVNFSFEFSYLSSVSRSFIEIRIFDIDETLLPDIKMDKMLSTSVL